jgi:hypothetical protein
VQLHRAAFRRAPQRTDSLGLGGRDQLAAGKLVQKPGLSGCREPLEEWIPLAWSAKPALPVLFKLVLNLGRQLPERHAARRIEELPTAQTGNCEDNPRLSEPVRPGEPALECDRSVTAQHALSVPPGGPIHLAMTGNNEPEAEQSVEVDHLHEILPDLARKLDDLQSAAESLSTVEEPVDELVVSIGCRDVRFIEVVRHATCPSVGERLELERAPIGFL